MSNALRKLFCRDFPVIASYNAKGELERPAGIRTQPRFKWVGPIQGWHRDKIMRDLTGKFSWDWGLMICNDIGLYNTFFHRLKWTLKKIWCLVRYRGHDRGGMFDSCSRCGD